MTVMPSLSNVTRFFSIGHPFSVKRLSFSRVPAWFWVMLPLIAVWPSWRWSFSRLNDGSDDYFGMVAIVALMGLVWQQRHALRTFPQPVAVKVSLLLATVAVLSGTVVTPLLRSLLATLSVMTMLFALHAPGQPRLAWLGLGLLSMPVITSMQFAAGYPLRVITAELSSLLLHLGGISAERHGSTLWINGQMIMVDAPCAGIHMGWMAYFTAFLTASLYSQPDRQLLKRLPWVGVVVITANVVRNTLLLIKEANLIILPDWTHEGIGVVVFIVTCSVVMRIIHHGHRPENLPANPRVPINTALRLDTRYIEAQHTIFTMAGFGLLCVLNFALIREPVTNSQSFPPIEWPLEFNGQPLQPQALSIVEKRFSDGFPGAIARFKNGQHTVVLRHVVAPTRKLHPASDCYKGAGYSINNIQLRKQIREGKQTTHLQRCFAAAQNQNNLDVCEYIQDNAGNTYTDTSAWYWAALMGETKAPWLAVTTAKNR